MQRYLAIETSSPRLSLAVGDADRLLDHYQGPLDWRHADTLFAGLERLLKRRQWRPDSLTGVAVSIGPGSFTGIRIGLAAARAMGQALGIPVVGVSALEIMAWPHVKNGLLVSPVIDALRGDVFTAVFERSVKGIVRRKLRECRLAADDWMARLKSFKSPGSIVVTGVGAAPYAASLRREKIRLRSATDDYPRAEDLLDIARPLFSRQGKKSYDLVHPLYLREAAAQERRRLG